MRKVNINFSLSASDNQRSGNFIITAFLILIISSNLFPQEHFQPISAYPVNNASITSDGLLFAVTDTGLARSSDFGATWIKVLGIINFYEIIKAPNGNIYLSGDKIYRSTDNGLSWIAIQNLDVKFMRIDDSNNIYFVLSSDENRLFRSTDSGTSFQQVHNFSYNYSYIVGVFCMDSSTTLITNTWFNGPWAGGGSAVHRSTNFGVDWIYACYEYIWNIHKYGNQLIGWLPPKNLKTSTDKGTTWSYLPTFGINISNFVINSSNDLFVSNDSAIYKKPSNNYHFFRLDEPVTKYTKKLLTYKDSLLFALSGYVIYKRNQDIPTFIMDDKPLDLNLSLSQNYPNPFNPSTVISYSVAGNKGSFHNVSLKVFNLLGQEVATLFEGFKESGVYQSDFNSSRYDLPNGIYLYRLTVEGNSTVKKMMLLK